MPVSIRETSAKSRNAEDHPRSKSWAKVPAWIEAKKRGQKRSPLIWYRLDNRDHVSSGVTSGRCPDSSVLDGRDPEAVVWPPSSNDDLDLAGSRKTILKKFENVP